MEKQQNAKEQVLNETKEASIDSKIGRANFYKGKFTMYLGGGQNPGNLSNINH